MNCVSVPAPAVGEAVSAQDFDKNYSCRIILDAKPSSDPRGWRGGPHVVMLTYGYWRSDFGGDRGELHPGAPSHADRSAGSAEA